MHNSQIWYFLSPHKHYGHEIDSPKQKLWFTINNIYEVKLHS
jgi:hypothetical protein